MSGGASRSSPSHASGGGSPRATHGDPRRIAYLVSQYPAVSHTFILREIRALRERGIDVRVIAVRQPDRPAELLSEVERHEWRNATYILGRGARALVRAHLATLWSRPRPYLGALWDAVGVRRLDVIRAARGVAYWAEAVVAGDAMRRMGITHVHAHFASHVARFIPRIFAATCSATVHGPTELEDRTYAGLPARIAAASFICATSSHARSQLLLACAADAWPRIEVVPLGIDADRYHPGTRRPSRRGGPVRVLCVARLAAQKGHHVLIAAVDELRRAGVAFRLRLVGDGPLRAPLEADVRARGLDALVVFEGARSERDVRALYDEADVFALTSFAEGMPVSLMEAMAMEIPCVATNVGGTAELIRDGVDGLVVPPADVHAVARALARLADDERLRRRLGAAGRQRVLAAYEFGARVDQLVQVFRTRVFDVGATRADGADAPAPPRRSTAAAGATSRTAARSRPARAVADELATTADGRGS